LQHYFADTPGWLADDPKKGPAPAQRVRGALVGVFADTAPFRKYQNDRTGKAADIEEMMRKSGLGEIESIRPARELFLDTRWKLGKMLRKVPRTQGPGRGKKNHKKEDSFKALLEQLNLDHNVAEDAQRIGTLPVKEKSKAYAEAKADEILPTISMLIDVARRPISVPRGPPGPCALRAPLNQPSRRTSP